MTNVMIHWICFPLHNLKTCQPAEVKSPSKIRVFKGTLSQKTSILITCVPMRNCVDVKVAKKLKATGTKELRLRVQHKRGFVLVGNQIFTIYENITRSNASRSPPVIHFRIQKNLLITARSLTSRFVWVLTVSQLWL